MAPVGASWQRSADRVRVPLSSLFRVRSSDTRRGVSRGQSPHKSLNGSEGDAKAMRRRLLQLTDGDQGLLGLRKGLLAHLQATCPVCARKPLTSRPFGEFNSRKRAACVSYTQGMILRDVLHGLVCLVRL